MVVNWKRFNQNKEHLLENYLVCNWYLSLLLLNIKWKNEFFYSLSYISISVTAWDNLPQPYFVRIIFCISYVYEMMHTMLLQANINILAEVYAKYLKESFRRHIQKGLKIETKVC